MLLNTAVNKKITKKVKSKAAQKGADTTPDFSLSGDLGQGISAHARAFVLHPYIKGQISHDIDNRLEEAASLARAIGIEVILAESVAMKKLRAATYIGMGKVEEFQDIVQTEEIDLVVMDCALSPIQQRNLEKELGVKVIDRTGLILEIFGERAQTREGVLQVALAHFEYQKSRLVRSWTHLERQRGGGAFMGGPGERQIESDRRALRDRISSIKKQLDKVAKTRLLHRENRSKVPFPVVALVGYTNAGKSTLFNLLTDAEVSAKNRLFETLDPTMRSINLPSGQKIILSDTVGFISHLPHELVAAFRATLEEVLAADLILHVRDMHSPDRDNQKQDVFDVMDTLGLDRKEIPVLECQNKIDLLDDDEIELLQNIAERREDITTVSAQSGAGVEQLLCDIDAILSKGDTTLELELSFQDGEAISWLYEHGDVFERVDGENGIVIKVRLNTKNKSKFEHVFAIKSQTS